MSSHPKFSVVIATRNRPEALEMSIPLLLEQSHPPSEILIVDSSDQPEAIKALVDQFSPLTDIPISFFSTAPSSSGQRNFGLDRVKYSLVIFPDDDSLLFPTCLEEMAAVYAADKEDEVVGVTVLASDVSPLAADKSASDAQYTRKTSGRLMDQLGKLYIWLERRVFPIPHVYLRRDLLAGKSLPQDVAELGCTLTSDMEGFRMSFRAAPLRERPFNEAVPGYFLGEDLDACLGLAHKGVFACLQKPLIFHHEFPGARQNGYRRGVTEILNRVYIVYRHSDANSRARTAIGRWMFLYFAQLRLRSGQQYQKDRLKGALAARKQIGRLQSATPEELDQVYETIVRELIEVPS